MTKVLQICITDSEFFEIQRLANIEKISILNFVKGKIFSESEFKIRYGELLDAVAAMRDGTKFNLKAIFGLQWAAISKGTRLSMGREFYKRVRAGGIPGVTPTFKDNAQTQWYQKQEAQNGPAN
jgi:hypothetical protein